MDRVRMNIIGLSYSQNQSGSYALILSEEDGDRRIPITIGSMEAQSIAIHLEGLRPPRPLTHDLFASFAGVFDIKIIEVNIYRLKDGVFYSDLICNKGQGDDIRIDSRTSDAVALALRFNCPIYMKDDILSTAGINLKKLEDQKTIELNQEAKAKSDSTASVPSSTGTEGVHASSYSKYSSEELTRMLTDAVAAEDYEKASQVRDEILLRKNTE